MFLKDYEPRFSTRLMLASSGDGSGAGGSPGSSGSSGSASEGASATPQWGDFVKSLDGLDQRIGDRINAVVGDRLDAIRRDINEPVDEPPPAIDYDALTPGQMRDLINSEVDVRIEQAVRNALQPLFEEQTRLRTDHVTTNATNEINSLSGKYKDYRDWGDEMIQLSKDHPTLGLEKLYLYARADNPGKAKDLDTKYNPPPVDTRKPFSFGPSSSTEGGREPPKVMTSREATMSAAREVDQRHGGALTALMTAFPSR